MIGLRPRTNRLDFGIDPDLGLYPGWIFSFLQHGDLHFLLLKAIHRMCLELFNTLVN